MRFDHTQGGFVDDSEKSGFYEVKTWWETLDDFTAWTRSESFAEAHRNRAPSEMFSGKNELLIHEVFLSTDRND